ncbi:MAG: twin-arginine translocase TatA/TatE family subunit [Planctomycetota bacterium]
MLAFWQGLSPWHLLLVAAIALLFYGNRLPEVARSLGRAVNEFKRGLKDVEGDISRDDEDDAPPKKLQPPTPKKHLEEPANEHTAPPVNEAEKEPRPEEQSQPRE